MKTIHQWFKTLPEPLRSEAIASTGPVKLKVKLPTLSNAVGCGFVWEASNFGEEFWSSFYIALCGAEQD